MIPRSWGGRSTRRKESSTRAGLFHLSKFPSTSAKWNIDTCIEPREDRISDDDKKRRERKEIFYIWRTLYPGYTYGGSRTMITRRRSRLLDFTSRQIWSGFSFKFAERNGKAKFRPFVEFTALWFSLAGCKEIWRAVDIWPVDHVQAFSTSSIVTEPRDRFILVERCYDDFKLFDYSQIGRDVGGNCIWIQYY